MRILYYRGIFNVFSGQDTTNYSGGGAGGSIWIIVTNYLLMGGEIRANGGNGRSGVGGGGGGGIIAMVYEDGLIGGNLTTYGGTGVEIGAAGVVYIERTNALLMSKKVNIHT